MISFSCSSETEIDNQAEKLDLTQFINTNLTNNGLEFKVSSVKQFELKDYESLTKRIPNFSKKSEELKPYSMEISLNDKVIEIHTIPTDETKATLFIESADGKINEILELNIGVYNPGTDVYQLVWSNEMYDDTKNIANHSRASRDECSSGAASVAAAGRVIAFGSFFGCVPCAFVGGAITALGSIGYIACQF